MQTRHTSRTIIELWWDDPPGKEPAGWRTQRRDNTTIIPSYTELGIPDTLVIQSYAWATKHGLPLEQIMVLTSDPTKGE
jgi:hypothetical protein